ncbi:hypothetical protein DCO47_09550 [Pseudomonas sp. NDM]|nr:hypothetical protein DCO47_09550 [Pseudomonas sp. NDM]
MLPLGCAAVIKPASAFLQPVHLCSLGSAAHSSGSKLPRHNSPHYPQFLLPPAQVGDAGAPSSSAHSCGV